MEVAVTYPEYAYVPGRTPRHPDGLFDDLRATVQPGASAEELAGSPAWNAGLSFLEEGYFWEAHEVLEPVWMALPSGSPEREMAQALIQLANAFLKREMRRPRAVLRLCGLVSGHLDRIGAAIVMGQASDDMRDAVHALENQVRRDCGNMQYNAEKCATNLPKPGRTEENCPEIGKFLSL